MAIHATSAGSIVRTKRLAVIALAASGALAANLSIYAIGRACGGAFTYTHNGKAIAVDAAAVAIMSGVPLVMGLALVAWLSRTWPAMITTAKIVATMVAVATIGLMTLPARFDTTSTVFLATMHLTIVPVSLFALGVFGRAR